MKRTQLIATLDLNDFHAGGARKDAFVRAVGRSFRKTGFFFLKNHHMNEDLIEQNMMNFRRFFKHTRLRDRRKYEYPELGRAVGYTPMRIETGEFSDRPDEKHFFHFGDRAKMRHVREVAGFNKAGEKLFENFRDVGKILLQAIALSLGLAEKYFDNKEGNSTLRAIHYPARNKPLKTNRRRPTRGGNHIGMCASQHTDINVITLLLAREAGLQLWYDQKWKPITIKDPNMLIVNCGDMLEHLTGGRYKSGLHQVVCKKNIERYSIPFFLHVKRTCRISPLPHLGYSNKKKYPYKTAGPFLDDRLVTIGVKKAV